MASLTFLGGVSEVTGSCHLLQSEHFGKILLDCGMHQGGDDIQDARKEKFRFRAHEIDQVILSHAHLDHSGMLPKLVSQGFKGPIHCTSATKDLLGILLHDSYHLYVQDLERENRRRERAGRKPLPAAYDAGDVRRAISQCVGYDYDEPVLLEGGISLRLLDAGHILGSSIVELTLPEADGGKKLVFSGDLGGIGAVLMRDPEVPPTADVVLMESTYGDRNHRDMTKTIEQMTEILRQTWQAGGNVLIPSFAVGRTQEILFHLGLLYREGKLDEWDVYLDSPMAIAVTELYDRWIQLLDDADAEALALAGKPSIRTFLPTLRLTETADESMAINKRKSGVIIIAGSGMCTGGRIRHHIKHRLWRAENTIIFVGFQANGTLGRIIVDGARKVRLFHDTIAIKARVETLGGFSAHAGQRELVSWLTAIGGDPKVFLVHGEPTSLDTLAAKLKSDCDIEATIPRHGDVFEI
ncbi:MAG: MBL fold metallo-hydrolase [Pseudomonadales bacterium]|nr:MBL fold metallo-hydrolase [Pseudomonadales bacterium]